MKKRPNILFVLSDQHNAQYMGCAGHPYAITPNMDRMAREGVRFENAVCQNTICTPSRICWHSGQYAHNTGVYGLSGPNVAAPTVFGHFRRQGYKTCAIGKLHGPEYWIEDDCDDYTDVCGLSATGRQDRAHFEYHEYLFELGLLEQEDHSALREFGVRGRQSRDARPSNLSYEHSHEGYSSRRTMQFMERCIDDDQPFFAYVSFSSPHQCYTPAQQFWDMYENVELKRQKNTDYDMSKKAPHFIEAHEEYATGDWVRFEPSDLDSAFLRYMRGYLGCVTQVDYALGELLDFLDEKGIAEDTIVVYSADHGEYVGAHGIVEKAPGICSDDVTRIPYIYRWKGHFESGSVAEELVETVDFVNTMCNLTEVPFMETADGLDITPLLNGQRGELREIAVTELAWSKSVRMGNYRYVYYPKEMFPQQYPNGFGELYDLSIDPLEMNNLWFDDEYKNICIEIREKLLNWMITTTRPVNTFGTQPAPSEQVIERFGCRVNRDLKINPSIYKDTPIKNKRYY